MKLRLGGTYLTAEGMIVHIIGHHMYHNKFEWIGKTQNNLPPFWWYEDGTSVMKVCRQHDIVQELSLPHEEEVPSDR